MGRASWPIHVVRRGRFSFGKSKKQMANVYIYKGDERMFTESEVKAMLMDAFRGYDRTGEGVTWERIKAVASEHGISFDPA